MAIDAAANTALPGFENFHCMFTGGGMKDLCYKQDDDGNITEIWTMRIQ